MVMVDNQAQQMKNGTSNITSSELNEATLEVSSEMCHYCFEVLLSELVQNSKSVVELPSFLIELEEKSISCPLFVTWDKRRGNTEFDLRGCIGTLSPRPLATALREYALISAFRDGRFNPIEKHEVPHLRVAVSLLVKYEDCEHCFDWEVGIHGIVIKFMYKAKHYSATYLPEVAKEQGWTQKQTILSLARKAGYTGKVSNDILKIIQTTRYQSSKDKLTYDDFISKRGYDPCRTSQSSKDDKEKSHSGGWRALISDIFQR